MKLNKKNYEEELSKKQNSVLALHSHLWSGVMTDSWVLGIDW